MSATDKAPPPTTTDSGIGDVAHVNFRVRCNGLGYGEEVFLVAKDDVKGQEQHKVCLLLSNQNKRVPQRKPKFRLRISTWMLFEKWDSRLSHRSPLEVLQNC